MSTVTRQKVDNYLKVKIIGENFTVNSLGEHKSIM